MTTPGETSYDTNDTYDGQIEGKPNQAEQVSKSRPDPVSRHEQKKAFEKLD